SRAQSFQNAGLRFHTSSISPYLRELRGSRRKLFRLVRLPGGVKRCGMQKKRQARKGLTPGEVVLAQASAGVVDLYCSRRLNAGQVLTAFSSHRATRPKR